MMRCLPGLRLAVFAALVCFTGCGGGDDTTAGNGVTFTPAVFRSTPRIRFFQAALVPDALQAQVTTLRGDASAVPPQVFTSTATAYGSLSNGYPDIDRGRGSLRITGNSATDLLTLTDIQLDVNEDYLLLTAGEIMSDPTMTTFQAVLLSSAKMPDPPLNSADIRFVNAASGVANVDCYLLRPEDDIKKTDPAFSGVTFAGYTQYRQQMPAALYRIVLTVVGKKDPLTIKYKPAALQLTGSSYGALALNSATRYTAILTGKADSTQYPLQLVFLIDPKADLVTGH